MSVRWDRRAQHLSITLQPAELLEAGYWLAAVLLGTAQAWAYRFQPSTIDLVSYLDIGDAYVRGDWHQAINGYWNPLYSWVLGIAMAVVRPSARYEYPVAKLVDFALYVLCLWSFRGFLRALRGVYRRAIGPLGEGRPAIPDWVWIVAGYTLFLWSSLTWITVSSNTPDMLAAALTYSAWSLWLRLDVWPHRVRYAWLGVILALSYFARTPMFIVGCVIVLLLALRGGTVGSRRGAAQAGLIFLALTVPFIVSMSLARGHLTIGDNGTLNHVWLTSPGGYIVPNRHWQGGPPGNGYPRHPSRLLWDTPPTFEFAAPIGGTYPPWTDPSYWYEGLRFHFDRRAEWSSLTDNIQFDAELFGEWFVLALAAIVVCAGDLRATLTAVVRNTPLWAPAVTGLVLYLFANDLLVQRTPTPQPPSRYVAIFAVVFICIIAVSLRFRPVNMRPMAQRALATCIAACSVAVLGILAVDHGAALRQPQPTAPWQVAQDLQKTGVTRGMRVATIGSPSQHVLWARLARVDIVAEIPNQAAFWATPPDNQALVLHLLARIGAQAVVSSSVPPSALDQGWQTATDANYGVRALVPAADDAEARLRSHRPRR
jgi:hypothetical protein